MFPTVESLEPFILEQNMKADDNSTVGLSLKHSDRDLIGITVLIPWLSRAVPGRGIVTKAQEQRPTIIR